MGALWIRALGYNSRHLSGVVSLFWLSLFLVTHFIMACSWNRKLSAWKSHHALPRRVRLWSEDEALCLEVPPYTSFARYKSDHENEPLCLEAPSCASMQDAIEPLCLEVPSGTSLQSANLVREHWAPSAWMSRHALPGREQFLFALPATQCVAVSGKI